MSEAPLPYGRHLIEDDDVAAVAAALKSGYLTGGPAVAAFEQALCDVAGAKRAVACANGTAALHLAALALDLRPGDAVVVPAITFLATANCARYVGADVVFADVDPDNGLMTAGTAAEALARAGKRAKAIFPVHLGGQCAEQAAIAKIARAAAVKVVEDACHAVGGTCQTSQGKHAPVGACVDSDMACFSFHPVKTVAMGEGGAITTNDVDLADRLARLRSHGMMRDPKSFQIPDQAFDADGKANPWYYEMPEIGFNYRASDINCALGTSQLGKLQRFVAARAALADRYVEALKPLAPLVRPASRAPWCRPAWHLAPVLIDFAAAGTTRARVMRALADAGVGTQVHYIPVYRQPYYRDLLGEQRLPGAERYYERALSLPLFAGMTTADVDRVVDALGRVLKTAAR